MTGHAHDTEGRGVPAVEADGELSLARIALAESDFDHAARHLAAAMACDPTHQPVYGFIAELISTLRGVRPVLALFHPDAAMDEGSAGVVATLRAHASDFDSAVDLLGSLSAHAPRRQWAAAPWFGPHLVDAVADTTIVGAVTRITGRIGDPASPELAESLTPWLDLARALVTRSTMGPVFLAVLSSLPRRLGAVPEAVEWCQRACRREEQSGAPTLMTTVMLGYAYRAADRAADAIGAWRRALTIDPAAVDVHIDLAELHLHLGDVDSAVAVARRAQQIDPTAVKPKAVGLAAECRRTATDSTAGDIAVLIRLVDLARAEPDQRYPRYLISQLCDEKPWLNIVPAPTEAIVNVTRQVLADSTFVPEGLQLTLTSIEAPSAVAAFRAIFPKSTLTVQDVPEPDIRVPMSTAFGTPLWSYRGTDAIPSVPPASPLAAERLYRTVTGYWRDPLDAYDRAIGLAGLPEPELLGLLAHVPPAPAGQPWQSLRVEAPAFWERLAQAWVCFGILHHRAEQPWPTSARRQLLLRLLFGVEDWSVDAAAFALCVSAWLFPEQRADIADVVATRYAAVASAMTKRPSELHDPLAHVVLACPGVGDKVTELARAFLTARRERQ